MKIIVYEPYAGTTIHFRQVGMIERIISLTWTPKGADVGAFSLVIPFSQEAMGLFQINRLVQKMEETDNQYAEPMIILHREISISKGTQKEILKIEGKSMLEALKWRLCKGASVPTGAQPPAAWALRACNYNVDAATFYHAGIRIAYESADVDAVEAVFEEMSVVLDNVLNLMQTYGLYAEISVYGYAREGDAYGITRVCHRCGRGRGTHNGCRYWQPGRNQQRVRVRRRRRIRWCTARPWRERRQRRRRVVLQRR